MKIGSDIVGITLKEHELKVDWRKTTNYAASIGDMNPCYVDDRRQGGLVAPPMYAITVTWPVIKEIYNYMEMPYPKELLFTIVHYTEHIVFTRLIRPGDKLFVKGEVAAVMPHKAGTHIILKFPVTDGKGNHVYTEYIGGMLRGVTCMDEGRQSEDLPVIPQYNSAGDPVWEVSVPISKEAPYIYDGCADVPFAIHTSPSFATSVGLPGIIYQGTATMAHAVRLITDKEAGGDPERIAAIASRFTGMVLPDSQIKVQLLNRQVNEDGTELFFNVLNAAGQKAISGGYVRLKK